MSKPDFDYEYNKEGINEVIDELSGSNSYIALREIRWNEHSDFKLDLRRYFIKSDGTEFAGKGIAFMSDEGPSRLTSKLVEHGFGDCRKLTKMLYNRDLDEFAEGIAESIHDEDGLDIIKDRITTYYHNNNRQSAKELLDGILNKRDDDAC